MKKRLLTMALAAFVVVGSYAVNVGDYIYSNTAKFKVTGENLVTNGDFSSNDTGWASDTGGALSANWGVVTAAGPNGENVMQSTEASSEEGNWLTNSWMLPQGIYTVSYWVKAPATTVTTIAANGTNRIDFFTNADGTNTIGRQISEPESLPAEVWTQVVDTVLVEAAQEFLVFNASGVVSGTMFTNFEVHQVQNVYDTRIVDRLIAYAESLLNEPDLSEGQDDFRGILGMMKEAILDPSTSESAEAMEGLIESFNSEFDKFMNLNGGNTNSGDWSTVTYKNWNNIKNATIVGNWVTIGDRWGFSPNSGQLERPEGDGYVLTAGIQRSLDLGVKGAKVVRSDLKPGKYFFAIEAQAVAAANTKAPYGSDRTKAFVGPSIFIGTDTLVFENDTLNDYYWKRYYRIVEIPADQTVEAGFLFPGYSDKRGGRISLRNPEFRMIGKTELQLNWESAVKAAYVQQVELKNRLDNYKTDVAGYLWEQDSLQRAIDHAQPIYEASLTKVTSETESSVAVTEEGVDELKALQAELLAEVNAMGRAKNWVVNQNAIQDDLKTAIANGQAVVDDPLNAGGDATLKAALQTAISEAQSLSDGVSATNQYAEFQAAIEKINKTIEDFKITAASRANPANITIQNPDFALTSGNKTAASFTDNGWSFTGTGTYKQWQFGSANTPAYANQWRGYTVTLGGRAVQTVTISKPGVYEYRAKAYATNDNLSYRMGTATIITDADEVGIDTTYAATPARLFFGLNGRPDSITVAKCIAPGATSSAVANRAWHDINGTTGWTYSVIYVKTSAEEETVEIGFEVDPLDVGQGMNAFGFGYNELFFLGSEAQYNTDTQTDLNAAIASANTLVSTYEGDANFGWLIVKLKRYIADAQAATTVMAKQNAYIAINEISDLINNVVVGIAPVAANPEAVAVEGIYTIGGVRVSKATKPGLYIINGKKVVIK